MPIRKEWLEFTPQNVAAVTDKDGVYELGDADKNVIFIRGTANLRPTLQENLADTEPCLKKAKFFRFEEVFMYTMRESELIQQHMRLNKKLPECNEEII